MEDWIVETAGSEKISFSSVFQAELVLLIGELFFSGVNVLRTDFWGVGGENARLRTWPGEGMETISEFSLSPAASARTFAPTILASSTP